VADCDNVNARQRRRRLRSIRRIPPELVRAIQEAQAWELDEAYDRFVQWKHSALGRLLCPPSTDLVVPEGFENG